MKKITILVLTAFVVLYLLPLGVRPLYQPDEFRYAEISREMVASGEWIVPHFNGLRYFEKPVLSYWLNAASILVFGENGFAVRFPAAMATGISALLLFVLVITCSRDYEAALFSALTFLTCGEVFVLAVACVPDSILCLFVTAAMVSFFFAYRQSNFAGRTVLFACFGVFCGLAVLTKGFLGLALPAVVIIPFLAWEGKWKEIFGIPAVVVAGAAVVTVPWSILILFREPDFWPYFLWTEHIRRFFFVNAQHAEPLWFYLPALAKGALPWTVLLPSAILGVKQMGFKDPLVRFAVCWFLFPVLFFSCSHGKLMTYILPSFPPLAILLAMGLLHYLRNGRARLFNVSALLFAGVVGLAAVVVIMINATDMIGIKPYGAHESWKAIVVTVLLLGWCALTLLAVREVRLQRKLVLFCLGPLVAMTGISMVIPDLVEQQKTPMVFLSEISKGIQPHTTLVAQGRLLGPVCWAFKRDDVLVFDRPGELGYGLSYDDAKDRFLLPRNIRDMVGLKGKGSSLVLVIKADDYIKYQAILPKPLFREIGSGVACLWL